METNDFSGRFLCLLLCVILLNGIFFLKVQFDRSLGLDLSGPESQLSHSVVVTEEGISQSEELPQIPLNELNKEYITVLDELKSLSLQEIVSTLTERMERLSLLWDGCILYMRQKDSDFDRAQWEDYAKQHLEVSENIIDGSTTQEDVYREYVAVHTLFLRSESLMNFPEYLQSIEKNKDYMLTFPIFRDENSFSSRNILKTADDFQSLQNVSLSLENTGAIEGILLYSGSDLFLILLLIVVALCFWQSENVSFGDLSTVYRWAEAPWHCIAWEYFCFFLLREHFCFTEAMFFLDQFFTEVSEIFISVSSLSPFYRSIPFQFPLVVF